MKPSMSHKALLIFTWTNKLLKTKVFPSTQGKSRNIPNRDTKSVNKTHTMNLKLTLEMLRNYKGNTRKLHI